MKKKLLNALRVRMEWLGYKFGPVTNPFADRFCIAVKNPDGKSRVVFIDDNDGCYDMIAHILHTEPDQREISTIEEGTDDGE